MPPKVLTAGTPISHVLLLSSNVPGPPPRDLGARTDKTTREFHSENFLIVGCTFARIVPGVSAAHNLFTRCISQTFPNTMNTTTASGTTQQTIKTSRGVEFLIAPFSHRSRIWHPQHAAGREPQFARSTKYEPNRLPPTAHARSRFRTCPPIAVHTLNGHWTRP